MSTKMHDKRKSQRLPIQMEINFSNGKKFFSEFIRDISTGGLQIETSTPYDKDDGELTLTFGNFPPIKVKGRVRWVKKDGLKYRMGVEFLELTPEQDMHLREMISNIFWEQSSKK
ncbi:MAG: PilZ domain-containing protein [Dissulfurimicrobium sp.]